MQISNLEELSFDVVVVGGGLAGVCAAIAAARGGSQVALVQDRPVLGGNSSSEVRVFPLGAGRQNPWADETGIIEELTIEDRKRNHERSNSMWDLVLYDAIMQEENISLFLNTTVRFARMRDDNHIEAAVGFQLGSERNLALSAKVFVDASGDGMFAKSAGASFRFGRESREEFGESLAVEVADENTLSSTLLLLSKDIGKKVEFDPPSWIERFPTEDDLRHRKHDRYEHGFWWLELGGLHYHTITQNEDIRHQLLRHLLGVWDHIKNQGEHGADNYALDWFGWVPGKRESRRFEGDIILNENHLRSRELFEDRVAYGGWYLDEHLLGGILSRPQPPEERGVNPDWAESLGLRPYSIPLRSLYSQNIRNLFFAGRNMSASHMAHSSTRVMRTCAVMGQAVGTAAALCVDNEIEPRGLVTEHIHALQQRLLRDDCYIPHISNDDSDDLARSATVTASSHAALRFPEGDEPRELDWPAAQLFPISSDHLDAIDLLLSSQRQDTATVTLRLYQAPDCWTMKADNLIALSTADVSARATGWIRFKLDIPTERNTLYWVEVDVCPGVCWHYSNNKHQIPVATTAAFRRPQSSYWRTYERGNTTGCFSLKTEPPQYPYQAANVLSGISRPESWTNIWISDPKESSPQTLELSWPEAIKFNSVMLTFDTNVNQIAVKTPSLLRFPECVRDYELAYRTESGWQPILQVEGNYQRRRIHQFDAIQTDSLRLKCIATNGLDSTRVYEIRIYHNT